MKTRRSVVWTAICALLAGTVSAPARAQPAPTIEALQASAKVYASTDWAGTFWRLCVPGISASAQVRPTIDPSLYPSADLPTPPGGTAPRENWYSPPAQIGDNLYFLGTRNHSSFALVARNGDIIVIDGNFEYATDDEIHKGLRFLGLEPSRVRYQLISHAHGDHDGGVHLTERAIPGATIVYGEGDWPSVLARSGPHATRFGPQNDGTDGRVIQVGDVSVRIVTMPGHTPGTLSFLFEYRDGPRSIRVAYVGGTAISFTNPSPTFYDQYIASSQKFARAAAAYGATALMSNHTEFDNAYYRANTAAMLRVLKENTRSGSNPHRGNDRRDANVPDVPNRFLRDVPNPYEVGQRKVLNYFAVVELCAKSAKLRATGVL